MNKCVVLKNAILVLLEQLAANASLSESKCFFYFTVENEMLLGMGRFFSDTLYLKNKKILVENKAEHCLIFLNKLFLNIWNSFDNVQFQSKVSYALFPPNPLCYKLQLCLTKRFLRTFFLGIYSSQTHLQWNYVFILKSNYLFMECDTFLNRYL